MNFCQEFFCPSVQIQAARLFRSLNDRAQTPFSTFYRWEDRYLLSASPERFLRKQGQKIISQPIKGTRQRGQTPEEDQRLRLELMHSHKDRSEHVMIVDLVRNDLARSCQTGSVKVPELYGIYAFEQVFQMISTVEGTLRSDQHLVDAIRLAFPMGSMTGAPKVRAMKLIEELEVSRRGLYSGAVGYITPDGNVDFNVVIRSLLYRASSGYLSFQVGGAIINDSDPAQEYEECLWKARAILETLGVVPDDIVPASAD
jgi:para-aminobenzoate synthetase component 1